MRVTVSTRHGMVSLDNLNIDCSVDELKRRVLDASDAQSSDRSISADHYLVFRGRRISDSQVPLTKHGVKDGARLVMLKARAPPAQATQPQSSVIPTLEEVERAIRDEAGRQGREVAQASAAPPRPREVPMEARLHDIMQALRHAARMPRADAPVEEVVVAEPSAAHMAQISDMGFSAAAARRALLLSRNVVSAAVNYLLAHGSDGDIEAEPTMDELRQVYHARRVRLAEPRQVEANHDHMELLVSMGFSQAGARHALVRSDNSLEAAINLLTSMPAGWEPPADAPATATAEGVDVQDAAGEARPTVESIDGAERPVQDGVREPMTNVESGARSRAERQLGTNVEDLADGASMQQASGMGSDMLSADEEQPLLGTNLGGDASAHLESAVAATSDQESRPSGSPALAGHVSGDGDAHHEHLAADVLHAEDTDHMPLDTPTMMELQEGMRGLMTALNATTAGIVSDAATTGGGAGGGPMSGAMPILVTGGGDDAAGMLDPMRIVDEMRWGGAFPSMLGGLLNDVEDGGLAFDDYQSESTVYADDDGESDEGEGEDGASDDEN